MKIFSLTIRSLVCLFAFSIPVLPQSEATTIWQVTKFDVTANIQQSDRTLNGSASIAAINVGTAPGSTFTVRINPKARVTSTSVGGASATFRSAAETRGDLLRIVISLPGAVPANGTAMVTINYTLPVEANSGLASISPVSSHFLPESYWYPMPNTPFTIRGVDTAPFTVTVNLPNVVSSGVERNVAAGSSSFEQSLHGQPFFTQGDWEESEGSGDARGIVAYLPKGASTEDRRRAENLIALTSAARSYFASMLGPAPDVPIRLLGVRRGAGLSFTGTIFLDADVYKLAKPDAASVLSITEAVGRLWLGGQAAIRGEGAGAVRDGLVRFLANSFLEKQFGAEVAEAELLRQRLAYIPVARSDAPISRASDRDRTYFGSVPNKGAMVWRLIDRKLGRDVFVSGLRSAFENAKTNKAGLTLSSLRAVLVNQGGESLKALLDQQLDQVTDTDLMVGLPIARGPDWFSALRNLGSTDVSVGVIATTERGEKLRVDAVIPAKSFGEAVFKTTNRVVRVEIDPEKLYPQIDYTNDSAPKSREVNEGLGEAARNLGAQEYAKAETTAREIVNAFPRLQESRILLARALLSQNKLDEAERLFRAALDDPLPTTASLAWANIGLGEISMKRGQVADAAKRFGDAVTASRETPSSLAARAARLRAEAASGNTPPVEESAKSFIAQLSQAIVSGKKAEIETKIVPGELARFVNGIVGSQPEIWDIRVLRTELLDTNLLAADVSIRAKQLGNEASGTAVFLLSRSSTGWKLSGIELFEVR